MKQDLIFDVGLHKGEDTAFYLKKGFRVVGIEANPTLYENARKRFAGQIKSGRLTLINIAVAERDAPITLYVNTALTEWATTSSEWARRNERLGANSIPVVVRGRRFEHVLEEHGVPYYLKVDIEGADILCLEALRHFKQRPKYVSVESTKTSWQELLREFDLFREFGYHRFKVVNQFRVGDQSLPREPREGRYCQYVFPYGSSGAFGEEAPGGWLTERQALRLYKFIFLRYKLFGDDAFIRRIDLRGPVIWRLAPLLALLPKNVWYDTHASR
jgi:FkbM family methyltransferase